MNLSALLNYRSTEKSRLDTQSIQINTLVMQSLQFILMSYFEKISSGLVITISCRYKHTYNFFKLIMDHLYHGTTNGMFLQLVVIQNGRPARVEGLRHYNLYMVDSLEAFLDTDPAQYASDYNINEYYYIFLQQLDELLPQDIQGILNYCWHNYLLNCNVQTQQKNGQILVYTYFPYSAAHCGQVRPVVINEFVGKRLRNPIIFPRKLLNMHGCNVRVATWHIPPFLKLDDTNPTDIRIGGFEGQLLLELAKRLNFTVEIVSLLNLSRTNQLATVTIGDLIDEAIKKLQQRTTDLALGHLRENSERNRVLTSLSSHYQTIQVLSVVSKSQRYTSLEILGFPFHINTWYILLLTLLCGLIVMRLRRAQQQHNSLLSFYSIVMGLATHKVPNKHYQRMLFINWTLSSFILRSIYTALLYDLFRSNLYRQPPNTIAELIKQNYTIILNEDVLAGISNIPQFRDEKLNLHIIHSIEEGASFAYLEKNAKRKLAALGSMEVLLDYGREYNKPGFFYVLRESVLHQPLTIYLTKHSFLINQLNECLQRIQTAGLMEYWLRTELNLQYFSSLSVENQIYIGQTELNGIYFICMSLLCGALIVFIIELCTEKINFNAIKWKCK